MATLGDDFDGGFGAVSRLFDPRVPAPAECRAVSTRDVSRAPQQHAAELQRLTLREVRVPLLAHGGG
jgi:hypothetical protein